MSERNQFDAFLRMDYRGEKGFLGRQPISIGDFVHNDNGTLGNMPVVASGKVGLAFASTTQLCLQWDDTADATQAAVLGLAVPSDFRRDSGITGERSALFLVARVRKLDGTGSATDNTDLALNATMAWHNPSITDAGVESDGDTAMNALTTTAVFTDLAGSAVLPAKAAAGSEEKFRTFIADLSAGMSSAQLAALRQGAALTISLAPNETVGTDLYIEACGFELLYSRHMTPVERFLRDRALRSA
ncbi:MAG: hypothetical protein IPK64_20700 [bacterium]|nr:hypothetical protein [bacterium]